MLSIDDIISITSSEEFEEAALEVFAFQSKECQPYREYLALLGTDPRQIKKASQIPFLPVEIFKTHRVYCGTGEPEKVFTSSTTSGQTPAKHYFASLDIYEKCFRKAFSIFYGAPDAIPIYALLPCYLEREGSSLVYMVDNLIHSGGGGFFLNDCETLIERMNSDERPKILLGVSYALWDLAEQYAPKLRHTIVMETGGMKGRRRELPREEFHRLLCQAFGVEKIHSEYGMAELASQAYSSGNGLFVAPPWMRISIRDVNDPFATMPDGRSGGINIIDLGNLYSCAFIETQDLGIRKDDGSFMVQGRIDHSQIRGCNLLVQ